MTAPDEPWEFWWRVADPVGSWHAESADHVAACGFMGDGMDVERADTTVLDMNNHRDDYVCTACLCAIGIAT